MQLEALPMYLEVNIEEALEERFMGSKTLYIRFLRKLLISEDFVKLQQAIKIKNTEEVLRLAHNLKGVCSNLALEKLTSDFAAVVNLLRQDNFTYDQLDKLIREVQSEWEKTLLCIGELEN